jgi:hypothetical protein
MSKTMSDEDKANYKNMGEYMYSSINFKHFEPGDNDNETAPAPAVDALMQLIHAMKQGLDMADLTSTETQLLKNLYGKKTWKKKLKKILLESKNDTLSAR